MVATVIDISVVPDGIITRHTVTVTGESDGVTKTYSGMVTRAFRITGSSQLEYCYQYIVAEDNGDGDLNMSGCCTLTN